VAKRSASYYQNADRWGLVVTVLAVWWLWMPAGAVLIWVIKHFLFGGYGQQDQSYILFLQAELFPHGSPLGATPLFWIWVLVGLAGTLVIVAWLHRGRRGHRAGHRAVIVVTWAAIAASVAFMWLGFWNSDKDVARYYGQRTVFYATGLNPAPSSLLALTSSARKTTGSSGCDYVGTADVPSCVRIGPMPDFNWNPRTASREAADTVMSDSSALASQVNVMDASVHYLPDGNGGRGVWTAILDGSGTRPAEGVAVWDGQSNTASICQFQGADSFDRAFNGQGGDSLGNLIAQKFPALTYDDDDIAGYCDGTGSAARPVIVIPVTRQIAWDDRTVLEPAGILVLRGSPSGRPSMTYQPAVRPGQYPCQVYPESIAVAQIDAAQWAAGRGNMENAGFGYQMTSVGTNSFNPGEYVLRSNANGRFYFVTPLTPRNSGSQAVVAYAVEPADETGQGLNPLTIYVQSDATNPVSMTVLVSRMTTYINQVAPALLTSGAGGQLEEVIPYGNGMWRGFVDIDGVTQDYIDMSGNASLAPMLYSLSGHLAASGSAAAGASSAAGTASCGGNPAQMPASQLTRCIQQFAAALSQREQTSAAVPSR
jgi:hypothetical protein